MRYFVFHALTGDQYVTGTNPITNKEGWCGLRVVGPWQSHRYKQIFGLC